MAISLEALNASDADSFAEVLGHLFEHSPWVAKQTYARRPFANLSVLHAALCETMLGASPDSQLALLRAHPELAGRLARPGGLTEASAHEQSSAGLDRMTDKEAAELTRLNEEYRRRFGYPFIICARLNSKDAIFAAIKVRMGNSDAAELSTALGEVAKIARLRLNEAVN